MRMLIALGVVALLVPNIGYADESTAGATVTYAPNTELSCPANAVLGGTRCYCNSGYKVISGQCVKEVPKSPGQNDVYQDIAVAVNFNNDLSCARLGFVQSPDAEMCAKYKSNPQSTWNLIQRPEANTAMIINPWAQPGQPNLIVNGASSSQSIPAIETIKIPPSEPTTTPNILKTTVPTPEPLEEKKIVVPKPEPTAAAPAEESHTSESEDTAQSTDTPAATSSLESQVAQALAAKNLVAMSSALANLAAASAAASPPIVEPVPPVPIPHKDTPSKNNFQKEPSKSLFQKIADWFSSIF